MEIDNGIFESLLKEPKIHINDYLMLKPLLQDQDLIIHDLNFGYSGDQRSGGGVGEAQWRKTGARQIRCLRRGCHPEGGGSAG